MALTPSLILCLFGWAGEKVAGGAGVGHSVGVVDGDHQDRGDRGERVYPDII
jgi:hypothetical protein